MSKPGKPVKSNILDTEKIGGLMFKLSMPVFMGMFVQSMYNIISTIFVGQYVGPLAIAGLSIAFPLQMVGAGLGQLSGIGGMSLISRLIGAKEYDQAEKALGNGIMLSIFLGIVVIIGLLPFLDFWLTLIGASEAVLPHARDYMMFITIGMMAQIVSMAFLNYARAEGNARVGMIAMIMGALINIALSAVFIVWLDMGTLGAGLATLIAQVASMLYTMSYYVFKKSFLNVRRKNLFPDFRIMRSIFSIGIGAFTQLFAGSLSSMILINMVVSYGGDYALSAFGIVQRVLLFANLPAMVISQGCQPVLGFNYGARRFKLALKTIYMAMGFATGLSFLGFVIVYFIPGPIVRLFSDDPELVSAGIQAARGILMVLPVVGPMMVGTMIFQAIGKPVRAFIAAIARPVVFLIPSVILLTNVFDLGINGIWYSFPASDAMTFLLTMLLLLPIIKYFRSTADQQLLDAPDGPGAILQAEGGR